MTEPEVEAVINQVRAAAQAALGGAAVHMVLTLRGRGGRLSVRVIRDGRALDRRPQGAAHSPHET